MGTDYDAFISYAKHDQSWVETHLLPRLEAAGITYLDYQQFQLGAPKLNEIERAILNSRKTLLVLSKRYLQEDWQGFTSILTSSYGLDQGEWPAIPLIIEDCELPLRLKALITLDLIQPTENDWNRLLTALHATTQPTIQQITRSTHPKIFHGIPVMPQHFIGRDEFVQEMIARLTSSEAVSVSTDGQGGIGKTTLAVALARHPEIWAHFPDGILWAGLGKNADTMSALAAWGEALGQDLSSLTSIEDRSSRIENLVGNRRMLLVIDDAWELDAANAMKCGGENCAYLLTTRDKGLATHFGGRGQVETLSSLTDNSAWNLLQILAPEACAVDLDAARALADSVGGLPLAIELLGGYLAAQEGALFPDLFPDLNQEALAELSDPRRRLQLATQRLGSKGKKMTLEQTLSLSLEDLPKETLQAFYALGAFAHKPATFSREAAETVAKTDGNTLALLASRNLLEVVEVEKRLVVHQTLADIARLKMSVESQARHRKFYLDLVNQDRKDWKIIEPEYGQITWGFQQNPEDESVVDWVLAMSNFQTLRGLGENQIEWIKFALNVGDKYMKDQGKLLNNLGLVYDNLGKRTKALEYYQQALVVQEELGDRNGLAETLNNLGLVHANLGQNTQALEYYKRALSIHEEVGDRGGWAETLINIGAVHRAMINLPQALNYYAQALPILEEVGNRNGLATVLNNIGAVYRVMGNFSKALEYYERALPIREEVGDRNGLAVTLNNIGTVYRFKGDHPKAQEYYERALQIFKKVGDRDGLAMTQNNIGKIYTYLGEWAKALEYFEQALEIFEEVGNKDGEISTRYNLGIVYQSEGRLSEAVQQLRKVVELGRLVQSPYLEEHTAVLHQLEAELAASIGKSAQE